MKILLARTDNIGDIVLSLPLASLIKKYIPTAQIFFLTCAYGLSIVKYAEKVDGHMDWDELNKKPVSEAVDILRKEKFDLFINVSTHKKPIQLAKKANIPIRIGTAHRLFHWFYCNRLVFFSRKSSALHEMQLNVKLLKPLKIPTKYTREELQMHLNLRSPTFPLPAFSQTLSQERFNLILHPGSNGNGREWPIEHFANLIKQLPSSLFNIIITGSVLETPIIQPLLNLSTPVTDLTGKTTLSDLHALISYADGLIASGTGPLHIAGAVGIHALGLYPPIKTAGIDRWGPIGKKAEALMHPENCNRRCSNRSCFCMKAIEVETVKNKVMNWLKK